MKMPVDVLFNTLLLYRIAAKIIPDEAEKILEVAKNDLLSDERVDIDQKSLDMVVDNIIEQINRMKDVEQISRMKDHNG
jgi:ACT domain-containing protein